MHSNRAAKSILLVLVLVFGSFSILFAQGANSQSPGVETILYFQNLLTYEDYNDTGGFDDFLGLFPIPSLSELPPTKENDSRYPPSLLKKGESKIFPSFNVDEVTIYATAWLFYLFPEFNLTDLFDYFGDGIDTDEYDLELLFPHPYRVVGSYTNNGDKTIEISDDITYSLYFDSHFRLLPKFRDKVEIGIYSMDTKLLLPLPKLVKNTTVEIKPKERIKKQEITLENVNLTIEPGDSILLSIEIIPCENLIGRKEWP
ncbi:MAG: hypothetical protein GF329_01580, partial [Candidatus Lokiarchaeota archaeon]|nr:hypothetical protein [Candidatus Lokiarchaeota archaeon]